MKNHSILFINNILVWTAMVLITGSCTAPLSNQEEAQTEQSDSRITLSQAQYDLAKIVIGHAERRTLGAELRASGIIDVPPQSHVSINMPYGGFVKFTDMLPGTKVKKGQFLVSVENPEFIQFQQEYLESLANREYLKAEFERQSALFTEKVASEKVYQQAKSQYLSNEARLNANRARLELIGFNIEKVVQGKVSATASIYAPVSGSIRAVYTNVGKFINPQDVLMDITNADDLHVELSVYEDDIPQIKEGQRIRFSLANTPNDWREAIVFLVGSSVREDRSVTVHGHLKSKENDLYPGMYVSAKIEIGSHEVWAIDDEAIVRYGDKHYVFKSLGNKEPFDFEMLEVVRGITEDNFTQITLVEAVDDIGKIQLVTKGAFTLLAKSKNKEEEE